MSDGRHRGAEDILSAIFGQGAPETRGVQFIDAGSADGGNLLDFLSSMLGEQEPENKYRGDDVVALTMDDVELLADAMLALHSMMDTVREYHMVSSEKTARHTQFHDTGAKLAEILRRMHDGPEISVSVTPF